VAAFGLHCKGVTSMARTNDPNSANSQFFLMRAKAKHLDTQYSIWGNTVMGYDLLEKPKVGVIGEVPGWTPDRMGDVNMAIDMPEADRPTVQVLRTDHPAFSNWLKTQKKADGSFPDVCELSVPTRTL
jgi:peptidylprolyl isomerase